MQPVGSFLIEGRRKAPTLAITRMGGVAHQLGTLQGARPSQGQRLLATASLSPAGV